MWLELRTAGARDRAPAGLRNSGRLVRINVVIGTPEVTYAVSNRDQPAVAAATGPGRFRVGGG